MTTMGMQVILKALFTLQEIRWCKFLLILLVFFPVCGAYGQQTVFDVPSADGLDKGKVYFELDGTVGGVDPLATFTPRIVVGIGHRVEVGMNFDGLSAPTLDKLEVSPPVRWQLCTSNTGGWLFYVGGGLVFPVRELR